MKRALRMLLCLVAAFVGLYIVGFGWLMEDMQNASRIIWLFLGSSMLLAMLFSLVWELYLHTKEQARELSERMDELEAEVRRLKKKKKDDSEE